MQYKGFNGPRIFEVPELRNKKTGEIIRKATKYLQYECEECGSSIYDTNNALIDHIQECYMSKPDLSKELSDLIIEKKGLEKKV